ncbi:unnamed protein product [Echinostoma caproni]|uniref:WW domain-containing protein n=1 Tax=Echinostoma caproni TaxID=27848 RepID=A0A183A7F6_9TREM|nr:unnamed protein product [Echinostoma caproni]
MLYPRRLQKLPCKDESGLVPMHLYTAGVLFRPYSILLVEHLAEPWTELVSRTTGQLRYFNSHTSESTFTIPPDQVLSFTQTHFLKVPWIIAQDCDITVPRLIEHLEPFLRASP